MKKIIRMKKKSEQEGGPVSVSFCCFVFEGSKGKRLSK
jgi:hypothetical protein